VLIWKEVTRSPETIWYEDPHTREPRQLAVTPELQKHFHDQGNAMVQAGLSIPVPLEHQPDAKPQTKAERAANQLLNNAGWVKKYALKDDKLFALCDIENDDIAKKLPRTIKFTSPWINSFMDGDGKKWDGVISHLALTNRPRIIRQDPFPNVAAALSISGAPPTLDPAKVNEAGIFISRAGAIKPEGNTFKPLYPMAFSLWAGVKGIKLAELPELKEKPKAAPPKEGGGKPPEEKPKGKEGPPKKEGEGDEPAIPTGDGEEGLDDIDGYELCDVFKDLMSILGVEMPEGITEENLLEHALRGITEHLKQKNGAADMNTPPPTNQPPNGQPNNTPPNQPVKPPILQESPPVYMSLDDIQKIADPLSKNLGIAALNGATSRRDARILALSKKLPAAARDKLLAQVQGAKLSLVNDGTVRDPLADSLDLLEEMAKVSVPDLVTKTPAEIAAMLAQGPPQDTNELFGGAISPERQKAVVEEFAKNVHLPPAQKAAG
jgi:hypothetical protein